MVKSAIVCGCPCFSVYFYFEGFRWQVFFCEWSTFWNIAQSDGFYQCFWKWLTVQLSVDVFIFLCFCAGPYLFQHHVYLCFTAWDHRQGKWSWALGQQSQEQQWTAHQHHHQLGGGICPLAPKGQWGGLWEQFKKELARPRPTQTTGTTTATVSDPSEHWPLLQGGVRPCTTKAKKFQQAGQDKHDSEGNLQNQYIKTLTYGNDNQNNMYANKKIKIKR